MVRIPSARRVTLVVATCLVSLSLAGPAHGALFSNLLPGLVSSGGEEPNCDLVSSQTFAAWGDSAHYVIAPGGAFEAGDPSWTLAGGAKLVAGNEPWYVTSPYDKSSLLLPAGASATSPTVCFAFGDWKARFFLKNAGSSTGTLRVKVIVRSLLGVVSTLDGGTVTASGRWNVSPEVSLLLTNLGGLLATDRIQLRVTASGAPVVIDDFYVDPWKST